MRDTDLLTNEIALTTIPGLHYVEEFITHEEEQALLSQVDSEPWSTELARRVQHYGYRYHYKTRNIEETMHIGDLPDWAQCLAHRLMEPGYFGELPDQVIVNEYLPGQGIASHIDCIPCFGPIIVSLSLNSGCLMDFTLPDASAKTSIWLAPRSVVQLAGEARYRWKHGIAQRKKDPFQGAVMPRQRRVSITFRQVKRAGLP